MSARFGLLFGKGREQGFTLIELLIVILIVGILAAVATPLYLGYVKDAKTAEAKAVVGSLWTAVQSEALAACGTPVPVSQGFAKAGLDSTGHTTPARWTVTGGTNTLTVACATGAYTPSAALLFNVDGTAATDVAFVNVSLHYDAGKNPPAVLRCTTDATTPSATSPAC
jgi:type IV pilus assembly protein PilA